MVTQWTSTVTGTNIIQKSDGKWENQNSRAFQKQIGMIRGGFTRTMSDREAGRGYTGVPFTLFSL